MKQQNKTCIQKIQIKLSITVWKQNFSPNLQQDLPTPEGGNKLVPALTHVTVRSRNV